MRLRLATVRRHSKDHCVVTVVKLKSAIRRYKAAKDWATP